ncbi:MAG TPA: oligosaccharide flippase family protein [Bradyrhizobium sp.]|nr:oligosaccharide flippase family protein [Bradyrhizobium sp.]
MLRTLFRHSYWNGLATLSHQGSTFVGNFLLIKLLDHAAYGKFSLLNLTALYAANLFQFAVGSTVSRFVARYSGDGTSLRVVIGVCGGFTIVSGILGFACLALVSDALARDVLLEPSMVLPLVIVSVSMPSLLGMIYLTGLLQGLHDFRSLAISSLASAALFVAAIGAGAWVAGLTGAVCGFVAGSTIRSIIMGGAALARLRLEKDLDRSLPWREMWDNPTRREIFAFQIPAGLAGFLTLPTLWLIPAILTRNTQNFSDMALYSVILMIKTLVVLPASIVALALQPSVERAWQFAQSDTAIRVFRAGTAITLGIVGTMALVIAVFAHEAMSIFGANFVAGADNLRWMMVAAVAEGLTVSLVMRVQASSRMWSSIVATLLPRDFAMLCIVVVFSAQYGLSAAVFAHVVGAVVSLAGTFWLSARAIRALRSKVTSS